MADTTGAGRPRSCDASCGCPNPCPGDNTCRCTSSGLESGDHQRCSCGEHCGCNPCSCSTSSVAAGVGKSHCKCGDGCTCSTCRS